MLKRKEPHQSRDVSPDNESHEDYKRRILPSDMIVQVNGSLPGRYGKDDDEEDKKRMKDALSLLQSELHDQKQMKQDLFLDLLREQDLRKKADSDLVREQRRHAHGIAAWKAALTVAEDDRRRDRAARAYAQAVKNGLLAEIEHLEGVNAIAVSDLDELRTVENEAATRRRDEHLGLPPAYGNLNDEQRFPPYSNHEDGGTIEVAHLKREVRQRFEGIINGALINEVERRCKLDLLDTLSLGLSEACDSLQKLIDVAPKVPIGRISKASSCGRYMQIQSMADSIRNGGAASAISAINRSYPRVTNRTTQGPPRTYLPGYALIQKDDSAPYVADRIAKVLLELLWRFAATCEAKPGAGTLLPTAERRSELITSIMLQFTQVDTVLIKALQLTFSHRISMPMLQYYLSQLQRLSNLFKNELHEPVADRRFFTRSTEWLGEQVEKERLEIFRAAHPEVFGEDVDDDEDDDSEDGEDDRVSSRWQGSDTGSGDGKDGRITIVSDDESDEVVDDSDGEQ